MATAGGELRAACWCVCAILASLAAQRRAQALRHEGFGSPTDFRANFTELAGDHGYKSEEHTVVTEDGYVLALFRIPKGRNCRGPVRKRPVLLMHGLLMNSDSWLDAGPSAGLAYLLADACYDLWAGNVRGTYYGRRNLRLDPDSDAEFWRFSTHEMGTRDLPAMIDYVLKYTSSADLLYMGYSQGGRIFFTMCSETSGYCEKARVSIIIAPAVRVKHTRSLPVKALTTAYAALAPVLNSAATLSAFRRDGLVGTWLSALCKNTLLAETACKWLLNFIDSYDPGSLLTETVKELYDHFPDGTSAYTLAIYGQTLISQKFQKYDYGRSRNLQVYGEEKPPLYNLTRATAPVVLVYGKNDFLVDPRDVTWLSEHLPNVLETHEVTRPAWNHLDNCYSQYTKRTIFPKISQYLLKYSLK